MAKSTKVTTRELVNFAAWIGSNFHMTMKGKFNESSKEEKANIKRQADLLVSYYYLNAKKSSL